MDCWGGSGRVDWWDATPWAREVGWAGSASEQQGESESNPAAMAPATEQGHVDELKGSETHFTDRDPWLGGSCLHMHFGHRAEDQVQSEVDGHERSVGRKASVLEQSRFRPGGF